MLTIHETFKYYGSLYKMNENNISNKSKELIDWLKLPLDNKLLKYLRLYLKIYFECLRNLKFLTILICIYIMLNCGFS